MMWVKPTGKHLDYNLGQTEPTFFYIATTWEQERHFYLSLSLSLSLFLFCVQLFFSLFFQIIDQTRKKDDGRKKCKFFPNKSSTLKKSLNQILICFNIILQSGFDLRVSFRYCPSLL
jgi:hypothetical protein